MSGVPKIEMIESAETLKSLMKQQKYTVAKILNSLSEDIVHSLTGWDYILDALSL